MATVTPVFALSVPQDSPVLAGEKFSVRGPTKSVGDGLIGNFIANSFKKIGAQATGAMQLLKNPDGTYTLGEQADITDTIMGLETDLYKHRLTQNLTPIEAEIYLKFLPEGATVSLVGTFAFEVA